MTTPSFEIQVQTATAQPLKSLDKVIECVYARGENIPGEMTLILPDLYYPANYFKPYGRILIQRTLPGGQPYVDLETPWFIVNGPYSDLAATGERTMVVECVDALGFVLGGRNVAYQQYSAQALKQGYADNLAKAFVRENLGSLATDGLRDLTAWLTVEDDKSQAAFLSAMSFERLQVLDAVQKVAQASAESATPVWMGFDIVLANARTGLLQFRTYAQQRGIDRRHTTNYPLTLSVPSGSLGTIRVGNYYKDSASYIYAGGSSVGDLKPIATAKDDYLIGLLPFGRRERYVDTQSPDRDALQAEAYAGLRRARPYRFMTAESVEVKGALRGKDWDYGDFVTAEAQTLESFDVRVNGIGVKLSAGQDGGLIEKATVSLRGESYALR